MPCCCFRWPKIFKKTKVKHNLPKLTATTNQKQFHRYSPRMIFSATFPNHQWMSETCKHLHQVNWNESKDIILWLIHLNLENFSLSIISSQFTYFFFHDYKIFNFYYLIQFRSCQFSFFLFSYILILIGSQWVRNIKIFSVSCNGSWPMVITMIQNMNNIEDIYVPLWCLIKKMIQTIRLNQSFLRLLLHYLFIFLPFKH